MPPDFPVPAPRVLLVEDDPGNAMVMKAILTRVGKMSVQVTEDGDYVLAHVARQDFDVVVMDVSLAHTSVLGVSVDGVELTRRIKALPGNAGVKVLLATAHAMRGDADRFLQESGADGYVAKPIVDHHAFVNQVRSIWASPGNP